jgi:type I restriction enzyme, S subunit
MKMYPKYKLSHNIWIGKIPEHWEEYHLANIGVFSASGIDKKIIDGEEVVKMVNYTDVYGNSSCEIWGNRDFMLTTTTTEKVKEHNLQKGDILFTPSSETVKDIGISAVVMENLQDAVFSYHLIKLRPTKPLNLKFSKYLCNNTDVLNQFSLLCKGTIRKFVTRDNFKQISIVFPPLSEQHAIADFLDRKTAQIDKLIAKKQRQVELLQEQRTALINRAVTKGLNPKAPMKDSGIEWLGEIPSHWGTSCIKYIAQLKSGDGITSFDISEDGQFPVYGGNGLRGYYNSYNHDGEFVLIGRQGALCGNINYAKGRFWASEHAIVANPIVKYSTFWLGELLRVMNLNQYSIAAAQPGLSVERVQNLMIPIPPFTEQESIAKFLEEKTQKIESYQASVSRQIELYKEYRTALISEAVTGKVDVRED